MVGNEPDAATGSTVATIGSTLGDVCFAAERDAASAAISTLHVDVALVDKVTHEKKVPIHAQKPAR